MGCKYDPATIRRAIDSVVRRGAEAFSSIESVLMDKISDRGHDHPRQDTRCRCVIVEGDDGNYMEARHPSVLREDWCPLVAHQEDSVARLRRKRAAEAFMSQQQAPHAAATPPVHTKKRTRTKRPAA